jgi:hypothetical protein
VLLAAIAVTALCAPIAGAVDISGNCGRFGGACGGLLTIDETTRERDIIEIGVSPRDLFGNRHLNITIDHQALSISAEEGCGQDLFNGFHVTCNFPFDKGRVRLGDLDDFLHFFVPFDGDLDAGDGNDLVTGGSGRDYIRGRSGSDILSGGANKDVIEGGLGRDTIRGGDGDDALIGNESGEPDGDRDIFACGSGTDSVEADDADFVGSDCEHVNRIGSVGAFQLQPRQLTASVGAPVRLRLVWTHPRRWRELHTVDLQLSAGGFVFGEVRFDQDRGLLELADPYTKRPALSGKPGSAKALTIDSVSMLLAQSAVVGSGPIGKSVVLTLSLRFAKALAGKSVTVEVGATDDDGTVQRLRPAGTIAVGRR